MLDNNKKSDKNLRFNILTIFIYLIGIVLIFQLFNLQVIHGDEYREQSNSRLTRQMTVEAPRGKILDRNGTVIATNKMGFSITLYKTNITTESLNNTLLNLAQVLEKNGDTYTDNFPISLNPIKFTFENDEDKSKEKQWKNKNRLDEDLSPAECLNAFVSKYKITSMSQEQARKVIGLRYQISQEGYSSSKYFSVSKNVSRETVLEIAEKSDNFPGVNIVVEPIREYVAKNLASHVVGYVGKISEKELETKKDEGYSYNDLIGKAGIENVLENYLKGEKGIKQIEMSASRNTYRAK